MSAKSNITKSPTGSGALVAFAEPSKIPLKVRDAQGTGRMTVAGSAPLPRNRWQAGAVYASRKLTPTTILLTDVTACGASFQPPVAGMTTSRECGRAGKTHLQPTIPGVGSPTTAAPGNAFTPPVPVLSDLPQSSVFTRMSRCGGEARASTKTSPAVGTPQGSAETGTLAAGGVQFDGGNGLRARHETYCLIDNASGRTPAVVNLTNHN